VLLSNFLRLLAFPLALLSTDLIGGLLGILLAFALAEALAFLVSLLLVSRQLGARRRSALERVALFAVVSALVIGWAAAADKGAGMVVWLFLVGASGATALWLWIRERGTLRESLALVRQRAVARPASE
jgi:hypothetical protein